MLLIVQESTLTNLMQNLIAVMEARNAPRKKMNSLMSLASALSLTEQTADSSGELCTSGGPTEYALKRILILLFRTQH